MDKWDPMLTEHLRLGKKAGKEIERKKRTSHEQNNKKKNPCGTGTYDYQMGESGALTIKLSGYRRCNAKAKRKACRKKKRKKNR